MSEALQTLEVNESTRLHLQQLTSSDSVEEARNSWTELAMLEPPTIAQHIEELFGASGPLGTDQTPKTLVSSQQQLSPAQPAQTAQSVQSAFETQPRPNHDPERSISASEVKQAIRFTGNKAVGLDSLPI